MVIFDALWNYMINSSKTDQSCDFFINFVGTFFFYSFQKLFNINYFGNFLPIFIIKCVHILLNTTKNYEN